MDCFYEVESRNFDYLHQNNCPLNFSIGVQLCQSSPVLIPDEITIKAKGFDGCDLPVEYGVYTETKVKFLEVKIIIYI